MKKRYKKAPCSAFHIETGGKFKVPLSLELELLYPCSFVHISLLSYDPFAEYNIVALFEEENKVLGFSRVKKVENLHFLFSFFFLRGGCGRSEKG